MPDKKSELTKDIKKENQDTESEVLEEDLTSQDEDIDEETKFSLSDDYSSLEPTNEEQEEENQTTEDLTLENEEVNEESDPLLEEDGFFDVPTNKDKEENQTTEDLTPESVDEETSVPVNKTKARQPRTAKVKQPAIKEDEVQDDTLDTVESLKNDQKGKTKKTKEEVNETPDINEEDKNVVLSFNNKIVSEDIHPILNEVKQTNQKKVNLNLSLEEVKKLRKNLLEEVDLPPDSLSKIMPQQEVDNGTSKTQTIVYQEISKKEKDTLTKILKKEEKRLEKERRQRQKRANKTIVRYKPDTINGLTEDIVISRIEDGLTNYIPKSTSKSYKKIFLTNIVSIFNIITAIIAAFLISIGVWKDLIFMVIVTANVSLGIYQEIKAKRSIERLSILSAPSATVIRNGATSEIQVQEIVLDDLVVLEAGRQICTDSIVLEGSIEVNESLLTGESDAILKKPGDLLYSGSFVVSGYAKVRVDKVGRANYIEKLTSQAKKYVRPKSDLLKSLNIIIWVMTGVIIIMGVTLFFIQYVRNGIAYDTTVRKTAGAMIGMIPSGLYLVTSMSLFVGVVKLANFDVLVRELYCIEMLARVNVLCLDKTGTITDGTMSVKNVIEYNSVAGLSTKNIVSAILNASGDRNLTSVALEEKFGLQKRIKHTAIIPFSSQRKYNAVTFERHGTFCLGAPEVILKHRYKDIENDVNRYASEGYRVLMLGHSPMQILEQKLDLTTVELVSLILIEDNVRPDAVQTISYFKNSGVEVKVISGDNPLTVSKVSQRAGIENATHFISLDGLSDQEVIKAASNYTVFGRVSPGQKKLLVRTLKDMGKVVAMTGDGVNDILALKEADCSIAVASGSDAAKNVSHLVLLDSNFSSMPKVVSEGRRVINNVAKVACLYLTKTIFSFLLAFQAINSAGAYPISTSQLFMIDLLCIGIPSFVLILEPNNAQVEGKFLFRIIRNALPGAFTILIISMVVFALKPALYMDFQVSSTIIVITATFTCMMVLFEVCRPYNLLRKFLCGGLFTIFIFLTLFLPKFFEFSPILQLGEYYDPNLERTTYLEAPSFGISKEGHIIIDGVVTNYTITPQSSPESTFGFSYSNQDGYLVINQTETSYELNIPEFFSVNSNNKYVFDGMLTTLKSTSVVTVMINVNGDVYLLTEDQLVPSIDKDGNVYYTGHKTQMNLLPTVGISNGRYIINEQLTDIEGKGSINKVSVKYNELINEYVLYINDQPTKSNLHKDGYIISKPELSTYNGYYVVGGKASNYDASNLIEDVTISNDCLVVINQTKTDVSVIPDIQISKAGFWIINGKYTYYEATGSSTNVVISNEGSLLKINGILTHYTISMEITTGGTVPTLPLNSMLLLLLMCSISLPLIRILKQLVPWLKKQYQSIGKFIARI